MHKEAKQFVEKVKAEFPDFFVGKKVLDVGSLEIDGGARQFFTDCQYHGIDLGEGLGVDEVAHVTKHAVDMRHISGQYDVVVSTEALEHDASWISSLQAMHILLRPGGLLIITCAGPTRWEHGTEAHDAYASPFTTDYYRNLSTEDFASVLPATLFSKSYMGYRGDKEDLYFAGIKAAESVVAEPVPRLALAPSRPTVTVEVSTLNRYFTTLPMALASIAMQTWKPDRLVLYDDGEQNELREVEPYTSLFRMLTDLEIPFETFKTPRKGLAANHQHALEDARTDFILRVDDDHVLEPRTLEVLMGYMAEDDEVGAVAPLVHHPGNVQPLPAGVEGTVDDIFNGVNVQWYDWNSGPRQTEHLYSCYLYRVAAARDAGGYPALSPVSFREDSWFSMKIARAGYKLIVTPFTKVHHLQQQTGGVRAFSNGSLWAQDDALFREWLASCGVEDNSPRLICCDFGIGDHWALKSILPQLKERHKERGLILAVSHLGIFDDEDIPILSIGEAQQRLGARFPDSNLYAWMARNNWNKPMTEAMLTFWK